MASRAASSAAELPRSEPTSRPALSAGIASLDDLARLGCAELEGVYRSGTVPSMAVLDGAPAGRMLTIAGPLGWGAPRAALAAVARSKAFPWKGKSFRSSGAEAGEGVNRALLLGEIYRFETRVESSAIDGAPCILLDYDLPQNPFFIRAIRDELREVAPGLHLGPAMLDGESPKLVLWFAIDTRRA